LAAYFFPPVFAEGGDCRVEVRQWRTKTGPYFGSFEFVFAFGYVSASPQRI